MLKPGEVVYGFKIKKFLNIWNFPPILKQRSSDESAACPIGFADRVVSVDQAGEIKDS